MGIWRGLSRAIWGFGVNYLGLFGIWRELSGVISPTSWNFFGNHDDNNRSGDTARVRVCVFFWSYFGVFGFNFFGIFLTRFFYDNGLWLRRERSGRWHQIRYHHHRRLSLSLSSSWYLWYLSWWLYGDVAIRTSPGLFPPIATTESAPLKGAAA